MTRRNLLTFLVIFLITLWLWHLAAPMRNGDLNHRPPSPTTNQQLGE